MKLNIGLKLSINLKIITLTGSTKFINIKKYLVNLYAMSNDRLTLLRYYNCFASNMLAPISVWVSLIIEVAMCFFRNKLAS